MCTRRLRSRPPAGVALLGGALAATWALRRSWPRRAQPTSPQAEYPGLPLVLPQIERVVDAQERRLAGVDQRGGVILGLAGLLSVVVISAELPPLPLVVVGVLAAGVAALLAMLAILPRVADDLNPTQLISELALMDAEAVRMEIAATLAGLFAREQARVVRKADRVRQSTVALGVSVGALVLSSIIGPEPQEEVVRWLTSQMAVLT